EETPLDRRYVLAFLAGWAASSAEVTLDEMPYWIKQTFPIATQIEREIAVDRATCTERSCPFYDQCFFFRAYQRGKQADILIINQSLWLSEPTAMPPFDALIVDEAHNLED